MRSEAGCEFVQRTSLRNTSLVMGYLAWLEKWEGGGSHPRSPRTLKKGSFFRFGHCQLLLAHCNGSLLTERALEACCEGNLLPLNLTTGSNICLLVDCVQ